MFFKMKSFGHYVGVVTLCLLVPVASYRGSLQLPWDTIGDFSGYSNPCVPNPCAYDGEECNVDLNTNAVYCYCPFGSQCYDEPLYGNSLFKWQKPRRSVRRKCPACPKKIASNPDPCKSAPCKYGGQCFSNLKTGEYYCNCPYPTGGKSCENDLDQCENCFRLDDLVVFVYDNRSVSFPQAAQGCANRGLVMHMPKTPAIYKATVAYLTALTAMKGQPDHAYWFGLNRTKGTDDFTWMDGTTLKKGDFVAYRHDRPQSNLCMEMPSDSSYNLSWDDDPCDSGDKSVGYAYYYLCEQRYPFFKATSA